METFALMPGNALLALILLLGGVQATAQPSSPLDAATIITRMEARNVSLNSYRSRVHVNVRMLNFPWLAPKLDGTAYYKRPGAFAVVFDRVPSYAHGITKLFTDIGDPSAWRKDQTLELIGTQTLNDRPVYVVKLTKKIYSTILDRALVYVDAQTYELPRMEWYYRDGGKVTMTQAYRDDGGFQMVATQHADIAITHVRAVADSSYGPYQTNIALDDAVFQQSK